MNIKIRGTVRKIIRGLKKFARYNNCKNIRVELVTSYDESLLMF